MNNILSKIVGFFLNPPPMPRTDLDALEDLDPEESETQEAIQSLKYEFKLPMPNTTCPTDRSLPALSKDPVVLHIPQRIYIEAMERIWKRQQKNRRD